MKIGIIGHGSDKFTEESKYQAFDILEKILSEPDAILVSGHSPVGGIDIWSEEVAISLGVHMEIKAPTDKSWDGSYGYKARNLDIAKSSDKVYVILVDTYPPNYPENKKFKLCYHCKTSDHVKSGGCWTGLQAKKLGKPTEWIIIKNGGSDAIPNND